MAKRKTPAWAVYPEGALVSLGIYIILQCLLAMLTVKVIVPESAVFRLQMAGAVLSAFCGGLFAVHRGNLMGTLWAALLTTASFVILLFAASVLLYDGIKWTEQTAALLVCMLAGGLLAGMVGSRGRKRQRHHQNVSEIGKRKKG